MTRKTLTSDAIKYNLPRHFGEDLAALIEERRAETDEIPWEELRQEILPLTKPSKRPAKARRLR